jgi:hypothetical protein
MFRNINVFTNIKFGLLASLLFCIPIFIYIRDNSYTQSWLVYLGSALFCVAVSVYTLFFNKTRDGNANTIQMIVASLLTVVAGIILSCIFCFILLLLFVPGYLHGGTAAAAAASNTPPPMIHGNSDGVGFRVFVGAFLVNLVFGSFFGSLLSFSAKRDQTKNSGKTGTSGQHGAA